MLSSRVLSREVAIPLATSLPLLAAWEILVRAGVLRAAFFPAPTSVAQTLWGLALSGELGIHVAMTLGRLIASFLMAVIPAPQSASRWAGGCKCGWLPIPWFGSCSRFQASLFSRW